MDDTHICRMSDPVQPHELSYTLRSSDHPFVVFFSCKGKHLSEGKDRYYFLKGNKDYFYCDTCNLEFHGACHLFPPEIKHLFHPSHPLTFILHPAFDISKISLCWTGVLSSSLGALRSVFDVVVAANGGVSLSDGNHKCKCCQRRLEKAYYHCSICNFNLNWTCSLQRPDPIISHFKSHSHPFNLFPIQLSSPCDACGLSLDGTNYLVYACLPCSHMIHKKCIYLPRVIKITRHRHRLSFTSSLVSGDIICGVCRKKVDSNYGRYSCTNGCLYAVHSKCATRNDVWDGKDLEGVPDEPEEDIEPFVRIDEETIQHFSHEHYLKLHQRKSFARETSFVRHALFR